jgi:hypothetical protein
MSIVRDTYIRQSKRAGGILRDLPPAKCELSKQMWNSGRVLFLGGRDSIPNLFGMRPTVKCRLITPRRDAFVFAWGVFGGRIVRCSVFAGAVSFLKYCAEEICISTLRGRKAAPPADHVLRELYFTFRKGDGGHSAS